MTSRAVVLGGGGVTGIAWETGVLAGLAEAGRDVLAADLIIGTSAGSNVAAQITSGVPLAELYRRQVDPAAQVQELVAKLDSELLTKAMGEAFSGARDPLDARRRIGSAALAAETVPEAVRREAIARRLPAHTWPDKDIRVVAVDAESGAERVFDRGSGVELVDAVAASSAVPMTWPPVTIGDRRYIDGGIRSMENADLAAGYDKVLVLQVIEIEGYPVLDEQLAQLREAGATAVVVRPDKATAAMMSEDVLDPGRRTPSAEAGYAQGRGLAEELAWFWE